METWFSFKQYNSPTIYGWGTEDEASEYVNVLNKDLPKDNNLYYATKLSSEAAAELGLEGDPDSVDLEAELAYQQDGDDDEPAE